MKRKRPEHTRFRFEVVLVAAEVDAGDTDADQSLKNPMLSEIFDR
jgi:hypothetical protein